MPRIDFIQEKLNHAFVLPLDQTQLDILEAGCNTAIQTQCIPGKLGYTDAQGTYHYHPIVASIMKVCLIQAEEILSRSEYPMPIEQECSMRFPGISPKGKYSSIDMRFAQQKSRIDTAAQLYNLPLIDALNRIYKNDAFQQTEKAMQEASKQYRSYKMAAKMCHFEVIQDEFTRRAEIIRNSNAVLEYRQINEVLEYMVGLRKELPAQIICDKLINCFDFPDFRNLPANFFARNTDIETITVHFDSYDSIIDQQIFSDPEGWTPAAIDHYRTNVQAAANVYQGIKPYCRSNVRKILDPLSQIAGKFNLNIGELIIIDGESVQNLIDKIYPNPDERTPQAVKEHMELLIANALLTSTRIDVYIPTHDGSVPNKLTRLVCKGYQPRQARHRVVMNAWGRFFSHFGFYACNSGL